MRRWLGRRRLGRLARGAFALFVSLNIAAGALPTEVAPAWAPTAAKPAAAETLPSPRYVAAAVLPNAQVGLLFENQTGATGEMRFVRYTTEHSLSTSLQLSTAAPMYPQLAVLGSTVVAAYVDTRAPNTGKLILRTSNDSGATWSAETNPFGSETFAYDGFAPRVVASRNGATLYVFTSSQNARPQYRSTTDLSNWTAPAAAGDTSMHVTVANACGNTGQECYRAHAFSFMETATAGTWLYVARSDAEIQQAGRGTQIGILGGTWSGQVDHGGDGGVFGQGEGTATTVLGRDGTIYFVRVGPSGEYLYSKKSLDGGASWQAPIYAYLPYVASYTAAAPVGLYVPDYSFGEYVWFAGFGGTEDTLRVMPLWSSPAAYERTGTVRLLGSAGSDLDAASAYPNNFANQARLLGAGGYSTRQTDLALPGRVLPFAFTRTYNSADENRPGALGLGWSHSYEWSVLEQADSATLKRGDGRREKFTRNPDGTYAAPLGVFDILTKNIDGSFTLTTRDQVKYEIGIPGTRYRDQITAPAGYWRLGERSGTIAADAGPNALSGTYSGSYTLGRAGAVLSESDTAVTFGGGNVDMGSPGALNISGTALSIEFWAMGTPGYYNYFVSHTDGASGYAAYTGGDATYHFYIGRAGGLHVTAGVPGTWDGFWHHFVNIYDGSQMKIYVDGVLKLSEAETAAISGYTGNFRLADYNSGGFPFAGTLDEVAVYARVLSASEVSSHYLAGLAPTAVLTRIHEPAGNQLSFEYTASNLTKITDTVGRQITLGYDGTRLVSLTDNSGRAVRYAYDGSGRLATVIDALQNINGQQSTNYRDAVLADVPVSYWRLEESAGTTAVDQRGANPATIESGATYSQAAAYGLGVAMGFPRAGALRVPDANSLDFGTGNFTVEFWAYRTGGGQENYPTLISKRAWVFANEPGWSIASVNVTDSLYVHLNDREELTAPGALPLNTWTHIALVYTAADKTPRLYLNGALFATFGQADGLSVDNTLDLFVARDGVGYNRRMEGRVDEVAVYASALSLARIQAHYTAAPAWHYVYDGGSRHIATVTDPDGRVMATNTYDGFGRLATQKDGLNKQTTLAYGASTVTTTDPRLHDTVATYDALSRPISVADTVGGAPYTLLYTYDDCGNRSSITDRNGHRTDYAFDTTCKGNLLTLDEPQLNPQTPRYRTTWQYDSKNNPFLRTDALSFTTSWTYDATTNVRLSETRQIDTTTSATTKWIYGDTNNPGLPTRVVAPRGNTTGTPDLAYSTLLAYDASGNLTSATDADQNQTTNGFDNVGRRTSMVDPDGNAVGGVPAEHTWLTGYDALDRVTSETDPLGHATAYGYDRASHRTSLTDKNGNQTTYTYDNASRLATVAQKPDPLGQPTLVYTTTIGRDDNGNALHVTQANNVVTDYSFDELNRMLTMTTHPTVSTSLVTVYTLDGNGNVLTRHTADNVTTTYTYDGLDRPTGISATGLAAIGYGYDELHRRTSMTDGTGASTYVYDRMGRLTSATQPNGTLGYGYDLDSNRTTLTYPTVGSVTYVFSKAGRLSTLNDWGSPSRQSVYTYSPAGLAKTVTVPGGLTTTYTYDRAQRLSTLVNATSAGTITSDTYTLDNEGNRTAIDETISGLTTANALNAASVLVNDATTTVQDHSAIALGPDGTYLIWDDARSGNADIYFSRRDALSGAWSVPNTKVSDDTGTRLQQNPALSVDRAGNAYALWQDERQSAGKPDIFYAKRAAGGSSWTANVRLNDDGSPQTVQRNPRIAGTPAGAETAVWVDLRSNQQNIYSATLAAGGASWLAPNKKVTDNTAATKDFPDVIVAPDGTSYAVWQDSRNGNADIYFSSLPAGGSVWAANQKISDDPGSAAQRQPRIAIDAAGNLTVVFLDDRTSPTQVRAVRRPAGGSWSSSVVASDAAARPVAPLSLAMRAEGIGEVAWTDTRISSANTDIWGSQYSAGTWATSTKLSDDPGTAAQSSAAIAYVGGELATSWRDDRSGNADVRARRTPGDHFALSYDGLNRLTGVTLLNPETFAFDGASNITSRTGPVQTDSYDLSNRLTSDGSQTYTWSDADRLTNRGTDTFGPYDALDRMTASLVAGSARTYAYNGDGLLQSHTGAGASTFLWDPNSSPSRLLKQGSDNIVYGLGPLYVVKSDATTLTFARDGSKNVRAELNPSGAVTASFRYRAYGQIAQSTAPGPSYLGLASQLVDPSGLYYMRARWYDPVTARFITRDPLGSSNSYGYADANPQLKLDSSGLLATVGDDDEGGACVLDACIENHRYHEYSIETFRNAFSALNAGIDGGDVVFGVLATSILAPWGRSFTKEMSDSVNAIGELQGCSVRGPNCLVDEPGTASGRWIRGHTQSIAVNRARGALGLSPIRGFLQPECVNCSTSGGGFLSKLGRLLNGNDLRAIEDELGRLTRTGIVVGGGSNGWDK